METLTEFADDEKCVFCMDNVVDELKFGKIYKYEDIVTHYFCMLFSAEVEQKGSDTEGIFGFLPQDIKREKNRGDKILCVYCRGFGATINCSVRGCKKKFHFSCGVETGSLHQFFGHFKSFCVSHRKVQNVPPSVEKHICPICHDEVKAKPSLQTIWTPCCKTAWFHRSCIQKMALSGGYFFRCPKCNNNDIFRNEMLECGIYIPDQDASWELEPQAYEELGQRHNVCDATICRCPEGRTHQSLQWPLLLCYLCGGQGTHYPCNKTAIAELGNWICPVCSSVTSPSVPVSREASEHPESNVVRRPRPAKNSRTARRKRIRLNDELVSRPTRANLYSSDDSDSDSSRGNATTTVLSEDSESDVEDGRSTTPPKNQPLTVVPKKLLQTNCAVIDLDSDDEVLRSRTTCENISSENNEVTSTSVDDNIILDDDNEEDDVVFVGLKKSDNDDLPQPTARLKFVVDNKVVILSPTEGRKLASTSSVKATNYSLPMWKPVPLHESLRHAPITREVVQDFNPVISNYCSLNQELDKANSTSDPKKLSKEQAVICID